MLDCLKAINWKKTGVFAAGVLFGTAGIKVLSSKDAKKVYTNCTAAVLRAKECVMNTVTTVQENAGDIYEEAKNINEERAAAADAHPGSAGHHAARGGRAGDFEKASLCSGHQKAAHYYADSQGHRI